MNILITVLITAALVGPVCWFGGANNARRTIALKNAAKEAATTVGKAFGN